MKTTEEVSDFIESEIIRVTKRILELRPQMELDAETACLGHRLCGSVGTYVSLYNFIHDTTHTGEHWLEKVMKGEA